MGLDYAYIFVARSERADRLGEAIALHLTAETRSRLVEVGSDDRGVVFRFPRDEALRRYAEYLGDEATEAVEVGYVYVSQQVGDQFVVLTATAATTGMSHLFEESPSVRATMRRIGEDSGAFAVFLDREDGEYVPIWISPDAKTEPILASPSEKRIDEWCNEVVSTTPSCEAITNWPDWRVGWEARDRDFYDSLGQERRDHPCRAAACRRGAITLSVFCRTHHFEHVRGRRCDFGH